MRCKVFLVFVTLAAAICIADCAIYDLHPYKLQEGHAGAPGVQTIAQLPLNLVTALPEELQDASGRVERLIYSYLKESGRSVSFVRLYEARRLLASIEKDKGDSEDEDKDAVPRRLVERLREYRSFDAVVMPSLVYREGRARAVTHDVDWDGVRRKLVVQSEHQQRGAISYTGDVAGKVPAVSLHLLVFTPAGERIFESYAGLDVVHEADFAVGGELMMYEWRLRRSRLEDEHALREGVALAFYPYLPLRAEFAGESP